ncbi:3-hydroxybutyrate dehydrogenase [Microbacterium sp. NPDC089180]|uniref:3-hydroxybutyrate dehydrogenase n=1 Tax=unclassified Microbacterium TaxID=2609290 RepID=UPI0034251336
MTIDLSGRRALVTGGAGGIGAAIARAFAEAGAEVTVADLHVEGAKALADEIGGRAWGVDLSDTAALADLELDVDILVNNAGIQHVSPIEDFAPEKFSFMLRLMLEAPFLLIRAALPAMYERGYGRVLNVSSVHGIRASAYKSAYVAAKHGLEGLSKTTALEGGAHGVTSVCIDPGYVRSPLVEKQLADQARSHGIPESEVLETVLLKDAAVKRLVEPAEVASLALWLAGPDAAMVTGTSYVMDGGWSAH